MFFVVLIMTITFFVLGLFAFAPFTPETPRRVDVLHYIALPFENQKTISKIMLGAPNTGQLRDVTNEMEVYSTGWIDCDYLSYGYQLRTGRCRDQM